MKATGIIAMFLAAMAATSIALPESLPMGVEVFERDGTTVVREIPHQMLPRELESRCTNYRGQGQRCTIGDGNCYKESPPLYCTWCGNTCKSRCVRKGQGCNSVC